MQASIILTLLASVHLAIALPVNSHDVITRGARVAALQAAPLAVRVDNNADDSGDDDSAGNTILMNLTSRDEDDDAEDGDDSATTMPLMNLTSRDEDDDAEDGDDSATTMSLMNLTSRDENDNAEDDSAAHTEVMNLTH